MERRKRNTKVFFRLGYIAVRKRKTNRGTFKLYMDIYNSGSRYCDYRALRGLELTGKSEEDKSVKALAEAIVAERNKELAAARNGVEYYSRKRLDADFLAYFEKHSDQRKQKTWKNTLEHLKKFTKKDSIPFRVIDAHWLESFQQYLLGEVSDTSAYTYYSVIKAALNLAVKETILLKNPADGVDNIKRKDSIQDFLSEEEIRTLHGAHCPSDIVKRAFLFSCYTGLRLSDAKALTWANIHLGNKSFIEVVQQKTGKANTIPLRADAVELLGEKREAKAKVFALLGDEHTRKAIKEWVKNAKIEKNVSFHTARHTFATLFQMANGNIYLTSSMLGHSSVKVTQRYAKVLDESRHEAINKLPSLKSKAKEPLRKSSKKSSTKSL